MCQIMRDPGRFERLHSGMNSLFLKGYLLLHPVKEETGSKERKKQGGGRKEGEKEGEIHAVIIFHSLALNQLMLFRV